MSRLAMLLESNPNQASSFPVALRRGPVVDTTIELEFPHRLFVPEHYEPGYAYPLVVWLHSDASSEMELDSVMSSLSLRNYVAIAPRGNLKSRGSHNRFRWGSSQTDCAVAEDLVWDSVQAAINSLSVHPDRIFLAGFGAGGTLAQWIGLKYAQQVAGVVSFSGPLPKTPRILSNWKQARSLKVLFAQRSGSTICSEDEMIRAIKTSHRAGLNYRFWQLRSEEDRGDEANGLDTTMLAAANRFIMSIVTDTPMDLSPEVTSDHPCVEFGFN